MLEGVPGVGESFGGDLWKAVALAQAKQSNGQWKALDLDAPFFAYVRYSPLTRERILCLYNFSRHMVKTQLTKLYSEFNGTRECFDLIRGVVYKPNSNKQITIKPYQALWLVCDY